jgi:hypothetical protein
LAVYQLRGDLECFETRPRTKRRPAVALTTAERVRELEELIAALDRRVPQAERVGEAEIANDAANLRAKAVRRLEELSGRDHPDLPMETRASKA